MDKSKKYSLKKYSLSAVAFLLVHPVSSQVVYTDVDPDSIMQDAIYEIDFNNDAIVDIVIGHSHVTTASNVLEAFSSVTASFLGQSTYFAYKLSMGATISSAQASWLNQSTIKLGTYVGSTGYGSWQGNDVLKYLGARFKIGANTHYGWVRLSTANQLTNATIIDFAYESTAGAAINAGDGIPEADGNGDDIVQKRLFIIH